MAENKKSFILYCDQKEMFEHLPPELCKELLLHLFSYVNDESPTSDNPILNALFSPIKYQLKRDLVKWETRASTSRENGRLGGRPAKPKEPNGFKNNLAEPVKPVTVNVTVNDNVKEQPFMGKVYFDKSPEIDSAFKDYLKLRKVHKYTMTERAINALVKKLRELSGGDVKKALDIIDNAILGKWKSFYTGDK